MTQRELDALRAVYNAARRLTSRPYGVRDTGQSTADLVNEVRWRHDAHVRLVDAVKAAKEVLR